jgi:hypothetical protein
VAKRFGRSWWVEWELVVAKRFGRSWWVEWELIRVVAKRFGRSWWVEWGLIRVVAKRFGRSWWVEFFGVLRCAQDDGENKQRQEQRQRQQQEQRQQQIPPLRCGMTNKKRCKKCERNGRFNEQAEREISCLTFQ